jgi:glucan phosphoethanolaminetransferase (alkaline phosphatase superfamily)
VVFGAPLLDSGPMERSMERWKRLGMLVALLLAGVVIIALYAQFQQLLLHPAAFIGAVVLAVIFALIMLRVALVPSSVSCRGFASLPARTAATSS